MNNQLTSFLDKRLKRRSRSIHFFNQASKEPQNKPFTLSKSNDLLSLKQQLLQREKEANLASEIGQALLKQNKDLLYKLDSLKTDQDLTSLHRKLSLTTSSPSLSRKPSQEELNQQSALRGEQVDQFCSFVNNQVITKIQTFIKDYQQIRETLPSVSSVDVSLADMHQPYDYSKKRMSSITDALDLIDTYKPIDTMKQIEVSTDLSSLLMIQAKMLSRSVVDTRSQKDLVEIELNRKESEFQKLFDDYTKLYNDHTSVLDKVWDLELHIQQLNNQVDDLTKTNSQLVHDNDILLKRIQSATETIDRLKDRENNLSDSLTKEMRKHVKDTQHLRDTILKLQQDLSHFERENNLQINLGPKSSLTSIVHNPDAFSESDDQDQDQESIQSSYNSLNEPQLNNDISLSHITPSSGSPIEPDLLLASISSSPSYQRHSALKLQLSPPRSGSFQLHKMPSKAFSVTDSGYSGSVQNSFLDAKSPTASHFHHFSRPSIDHSSNLDFSVHQIHTHELDGPSQEPITTITLDSDQSYHERLASPRTNASSAAGMDISFFCMNSDPTSTLTFKEKDSESASPSYNRPISDLISMSHNIQSKEAPLEKYQSDIDLTMDQLTSHSRTIPRDISKKHTKPRALSYCPSNDFSVISEDESSLHNPILASEILGQRAAKKASRASSFQPILSEEDLGPSRSPYSSKLSLRRSSRSITNSDTLKLKSSNPCSLPNKDQPHNNDVFKMNTFKLITKTMNKKRNSVNPEFTHSATGKVIEQLTSDPKLQPIATRIFELGDKIIYQEIVKSQTVLYEEDELQEHYEDNRCTTCVNCRRLSHQQSNSIKQTTSQASSNLYTSSNPSSTRTKLDLKLVPTNLTSSFNPVAEVDTELEEDDEEIEEIEDEVEEYPIAKPVQSKTSSFLPLSSALKADFESPTVPKISTSPHHRTHSSSNPLANLGIPMGIQSTPALNLTQRAVPIHATSTNPLKQQTSIMPSSVMERNLSDDDSRLMIFASISEAIQEVMQGEFMWKSTQKTLLNPSEKRHLRFFWVNPQSRILYWSVKNPGTERSLYIKESSNGKGQLAKSALIVGVSLVADVIEDSKGELNNNARDVPPPLSIVIRTNRRSIKIKAQSETRHGIWMMALNYLQTTVPTHLGGTNGTSEVTGVHRPDFALGLTPPQSGGSPFIGNGFGSLKRNSQVISW